MRVATGHRPGVEILVETSFVTGDFLEGVCVGQQILILRVGFVEAGDSVCRPVDAWDFGIEYPYSCRSFLVS